MRRGALLACLAFAAVLAAAAALLWLTRDAEPRTEPPREVVVGESSAPRVPSPSPEPSVSSPSSTPDPTADDVVSPPPAVTDDDDDDRDDDDDDDDDDRDGDDDD